MESIKIKNFKQFLVSEEKTIRYCIIKLNNFKIKTLFVVNNLKEKIIIGSITDGDIRRAFINGFNANDRISKIALKKCFSINELHEIESKKEIFEKYSVFFLPQINLKKRITNIYHLKENDDHKSIKFGNKNNPILLMAGGKGIRLGALTKNTPKPILSIKKITIIDRILDQLIEQEFTNVHISILYLKDKVKKSLLKYSNKINIKFIEEPFPLGTIGSINKIKNKTNEPIVVIFSDIVTNFDIQKVIKFHLKTKSKLTIVAKKHYMQNPYGVLNIDSKDKVKSISEKPTTESLIAAGIFVIDNNLTSLVRKKVKTDMDFFINKVLNKKLKVSVYNLEDYWYDLGTANKLNNFKDFLG